MTSSSQPFYCPRCLLAHQSAELSSLKASVEALSIEVSDLKALVVSLSSNNGPQVGRPVTSVSLSQEAPSAPSQPPSPPTQLPHPTVAASTTDRRFNIVVFGVPELPRGSSRYVRCRGDFNEVSSAITGLEQGSDHTSSIRD